MERENWTSKLGFILAAAGSAIGLGNIWRFPYVTGTNGGAIFILIYLSVPSDPESFDSLSASIILATLEIGSFRTLAIMA